MHLAIELADLQPIIDRAVSMALDKYALELKSICASTAAKRLKTVDEAADFLNVCAKTVRNWIDDGSITAVRLGGSVRLAHEDLERFVAKNKTSTQPTNSSL